MARAILHIGTHKTGTTLIQNTLAANRAALERAGLIYPAVGVHSGHHALLTRWLDLAPHYHAPADPAELWQGLARHAHGDGVLLLSSEEFSRAARKRVDLAEVRAFLAGFERVEVVCFLRDQPSYLQSIYLEVLKLRTPTPFPALLRRVLDEGLAAGVHLDYGALHDQFLAAFAPDEITFVDLATARAGPGGVLGALLARTGLAIDPGRLVPVPEDQANVSPEPLAAWMAGVVAAPAPPSPGLIAAARDALAAEFAGTAAAEGGRLASTLFTRAERRRLVAHVAPRNAAFEARVRAVQPGFALSPPPEWPAGPAAGMIWRDDLGAGAWARLARSVWQAGGGG